MLGLPLATLGLMGAGYLGKKVGWSMEDEREEKKRAEFGERARGMQEGIDQSTPEGQQEYAMRLLSDPQTAQFGGAMLGDVLQRAQQQQQFDYGMQNVSATDQARIGLQREGMQQQAQEAAARLAQGQQGLDLQQQQQLWERTNMTPFQQAQIDATKQKPLFDPAEAQKQNNVLMNMASENFKPYRASLGAYNVAMGVINNPESSPSDYAASVTAMAKAFDPTGTVQTSEGEIIREGAGGYLDNLRQMLQQAKTGGLNEKTKKSFSSTLNAMMEQKALEAQRTREFIDANARPNPVTGMPAFDTAPFYAGLDFEPTKKWRDQLGQQSMPAAKNGEFSDKQVDDMIDNAIKANQRRR